MHEEIAVSFESRFKGRDKLTNTLYIMQRMRDIPFLCRASKPFGLALIEPPRRSISSIVVHHIKEGWSAPDAVGGRLGSRIHCGGTFYIQSVCVRKDISFSFSR